MIKIQTNSPSLWLRNFPKLKPDVHKYKRGYVAVNGGDVASTGATRLAAMASLRIGAGLVSVLTNKEALPIYASTLTAVMTKLVESCADYSAFVKDDKVTTLLLGPANGVSEETKKRILAALETKKPTVLDADALSSFEGNVQKLSHALHGYAVLTPHEGEFAKLFGNAPYEEERVSAALYAAEQTGAVIVLKGRHTVIASPDGKQCVINKNAPPYLATAGSGDVLAGMIAGLLAQSMPAFEASCAAVWMHGEAANQFGRGLIAEDLPHLLPSVMQSLLNQK